MVRGIPRRSCPMAVERELDAATALIDLLKTLAPTFGP
jgi:hypothetical protein